MGRENEDKWLDEALDNAISSHDTQPDFERWKASHPEAVHMLTSRARPDAARPSVIRRIKMNSMLVKLAAAAVIAIAAIFGVTQLMQPDAGEPAAVAQTFTGPMTHGFPDGSTVTLGTNASIRTYGTAGKRGFEHLTGVVDVAVAKGKGEFIVTTPYGDVKALGTEFTMDLVDGVAQTGDEVKLLEVKVTEGKVEVSNTRGRTILEATQDTIVERDTAPYDFNQDERLPERLRERIQAMVAAFGAGDPAAWAANFNIDYIYRLGKGRVQYDPNLFGGSKEDAERLAEVLKDVKSPEELSQIFLGTINITEPVKVYVRCVELSADGNHARAECVRRKTGRTMTMTSPQWHHFDNDWWQIDD
ncbi:MAG: FecR domain-containing protein [Sedimentisphaerales bacterium]|nr:FecR domain-containing protein [Sedimentisphaerales bacterium]